MTSLPLGKCLVPIQRSLTTSSTAIFVPFTTQELFQSGGEALYYGLNALSSNLIMVDRKQLKNPNGLILGTPGSGKSFAAKREITNVFLITTDDIIVCDPEGEYAPLIEAMGDLGSVILFLAFLAWAVAARIAAKKRGDVGGTSVSGAAARRNDFIALGAGLAFYIVFALWLHPALIGVAVITRAG